MSLHEFIFNELIQSLIETEPVKIVKVGISFYLPWIIQVKIHLQTIDLSMVSYYFFHYLNRNILNNFNIV